MQFNPKIGFILGILVTIETAISGGILNLTNAIPHDWIPVVVAWSSILAFGGSTVLTFLHAFSSGEAGPMVVPPFDPAAKAEPAMRLPPKTTGLIIALGLCALALASGPAQAQPAPKFTGNPIKDFAPPPRPTAPAGAIASPVYDTIGGELQKVVKDVIDRAITDLTAASADAAGTKDLISQPCWDAQIAFLKLLPAEWPTPPTDVGPALAIQIGRDLRRALTSDSQGSLKVACAALFGDELQQAGKLFSILGIKAAGAAIGLPGL